MSEYFEAKKCSMNTFSKNCEKFFGSVRRAEKMWIKNRAKVTTVGVRFDMNTVQYAKKSANCRIRNLMVVG